MGCQDVRTIDEGRLIGVGGVWRDRPPGMRRNRIAVVVGFDVRDVV